MPRVVLPLLLLALAVPRGGAAVVSGEPAFFRLTLLDVPDLDSGTYRDAIGGEKAQKLVEACTDISRAKRVSMETAPCSNSLVSDASLRFADSVKTQDAPARRARPATRTMPAV